MIQQTHSFAPSAILFDMDGLLVDSEPLWFSVERAFAASRGGDWTDEQAAACVGKGLLNTLRAMQHAFGFAVDVERDADEVVNMVIARAGEIRLKPGALALLDDAKGKAKLALASSSSLRLIEAVLREVGVYDRFDAVVSGEQVAHPKPAPDIFLHAASLLGVPPARAVVLEDSIAGVTAGRAAGMFVIAVPEGSVADRPFSAHADVIVSDLFEARAHLSL